MQRTIPLIEEECCRSGLTRGSRGGSVNELNEKLLKDVAEVFDSIVEGTLIPT